MNTFKNIHSGFNNKYRYDLKIINFSIYSNGEVVVYIRPLVRVLTDESFISKFGLQKRFASKNDNPNTIAITGIE